MRAIRTRRSSTFGDVTTPGSCAGNYDRTRTWTAKDACGNLSNPVSQTINVVDTDGAGDLGAAGAGGDDRVPGDARVFTTPTTPRDAL